VRHSREEDLPRLAAMVVQLRTVEGLTEKKPGTFYRGSRAFLHFHIHGDDVYADVRLSGDEFERLRVTTRAEQRSLVSAVRHALRVSTR
jgi:hypothetical protein